MPEEVPGINLELFTPAQLIELEKKVKEQLKSPAVFRERVCGLTPEVAKEILCEVARANQEAKTGWQKYTMDTIERNMKKK